MKSKPILIDSEIEVLHSFGNQDVRSEVAAASINHDQVDGDIQYYFAGAEMPREPRRLSDLDRVKYE